MLRLYVMRHAKSSWAVPGARDHDRELNDRGHTDLAKISKVISEKGYVPQMVLCSPAARTRQTLDGIRDVLLPEPEILFEERLYSGGMQDYLAMIAQVPEPVSVMTIGHNPMSGALAATLAGNGEPEMLSEIAYRYPTATIAVIDFEIDHWSQIRPGKGYLSDCLIPSRLPKPDRV